MSITKKPVWKMGGQKNYSEKSRLFCYVECMSMDDAFRISRATFGDHTITFAQRLAHNEKIDDTLPYFSEKGGV